MPGKPPKGFSTALTGKGAPGTWVIDVDTQDPSHGNVLAQTNMDKTGYRFPVCVYDAISAKNVDVSVQFKPVKGKGDQAAGIVWRYKDKDNYYIIRANALEDNVNFYKYASGQRSGIRDGSAKVMSGQWQELRVEMTGTAQAMASKATMPNDS